MLVVQLLGVVRIADLLASQAKDSEQPEIESVVLRSEKNLSEARQQFPGDAYRLTAESEFAKKMA